MHRLRTALIPGLIAGAVACADATGPVRTVNGLEYRAWTDILESYPIQLHVHVEIRNRRLRTTTVEFPDGCVVLVRAFREGVETAAWDQAQIVGCTDAIVTVQLRPGESRRFESRTGAGEILGDSLPDGYYRIEACLRPRSGPIRLDAGLAPLSVPRSLSIRSERRVVAPS
ncbi:MAG: hypothetical protein L0271_20940 [Gemmatimonadetes bacterium]|nr:hypothetical protein [Gemmatimonadota bacterium]